MKKFETDVGEKLQALSAQQIHWEQIHTLKQQLHLSKQQQTQGNVKFGLVQPALQVQTNPIRPCSLVG